MDAYVAEPVMKRKDIVRPPVEGPHAEVIGSLGLVCVAIFLLIIIILDIDLLYRDLKRLFKNSWDFLKKQYQLKNNKVVSVSKIKLDTY